MLKKLNLQLFAEEEVESGGYEGEEEFIDELDDFDLEDAELEDDELDDDLGEDEEELDDDEETNPSLDKKTKAIIKHKKEAKAYKEQLQAVQEQLQNIELEKEEAKRIKELEKGGATTDEATKTAKDESEMKKLRIRLTAMELDRLEDKYPGISRYSKELSESKQQLPEFSYEQLYLANYSKQNEFDRRTKLEQEMVYKNKKARDKSLDRSNPRTKKTTKLSKEDERTYQYLRNSKPTLTRKQYKALMDSDTLE